MKIKEIYIDGFNNIKDSRVSLETLTSLVALNNYGKSNLLKGIKKFEQIIKNNNIRLLNEDFSFNRHMVNTPITFGVVFTKNSEEYRYTLVVERKIEAGNLFCQEKLEVKIDSAKFATLFSRENNQVKYKSSLKMDRMNSQSELLKSQESELALKKLSYSDSLDYLYIIEEILNFNVTIAELQGVAVKTIFKDKNSEFNTLSGEGFEKILFYLYESRHRDYELLENMFKKLIPEIESISIEKRQSKSSDLESIIDIYEEYRIYVKEKNNLLQTPFSKLSLGSQRIFILLLILIYFKESNSLILLEELENCIHPKLFHSFIKTIKLLDCNAQLIITSHSPYVIQYMEIESIYLGIPNEKSIAKFISPSKMGVKKIKNYSKEEGISSGEFIFNLLLDNIEENKDLQEIMGESWKNI